jgi:hypothetical protein
MPRLFGKDQMPQGKGVPGKPPWLVSQDIRLPSDFLIMPHQPHQWVA